MPNPTFCGESESRINHRIGVQVGRELADNMPKGVTLGYAIRQHIRELSKGIRLGPFELDYKSGLCVGWNRRKWGL